MIRQQLAALAMAAGVGCAACGAPQSPAVAAAVTVRSPLTFDSGRVTLAPTAPGDEPSVSAAVAAEQADWSRREGSDPHATVRLVRLTTRDGAGPVEHHGDLAWAFLQWGVLLAPAGPAQPTDDGVVLSLVDATTGAGLFTEEGGPVPLDTQALGEAPLLVPLRTPTSPSASPGSP
jgi:hypothetical protein